MLYVQTADGPGRMEHANAEEVALLTTPYRDLTEAIAATGGLSVLERAPVRDRLAIESVLLSRPIRQPPTIWGVGLNYHSKAILTGRPVPDTPLLFVKGAAAFAGDGDDITLPSELSREPDYEAEVALLIGTAIENATPERAWRAVAGLLLANDMTARDTMRATNSPLLAKSFAGACPIGPSVLATADLAPSFDLGLRSIVNGTLRQDGRTSDVIFPPDELLACISRYTTLQPGDIVLTGTPAGTGQDLGVYLADGDNVRIELDGLLPLSNLMRAPSSAAVAGRDTMNAPLVG